MSPALRSILVASLLSLVACGGGSPTGPEAVDVNPAARTPSGGDGNAPAPRPRRRTPPAT